MLRPKPCIENLTPVSHGGINYAELRKLGIKPSEVLDFSVSTNFCGPPAAIKKALAEASVSSYPDSNSTELKARLAIKLDIHTDNLIIGGGSTELIRMVTAAYLNNGDTALTFQPTYGEYELSCQIVGAKVIQATAGKKNSFQLLVPEFTEMIQRHHPKVIFICNPNNPTGQYLTKPQVRRILQAGRDSLTVLDEAYLAFTDDAWSSLDLINRNNLFIVRSMTKDYALAGLRLGYGIANRRIIDVLNKVKPPWNVSSLAQRGGICVINDERYLESSRIRVRKTTLFLKKGLEKLGLKPLPSRTNFFLVKVGNAAALRQALVKKGILVRDCASFGMPEYIRLAARPINECRKLISALKEIGV